MKPITDPRELKQRTALDYAATVRRAGVLPDMASCERWAQRDLETTDQHAREATPAPKPAKKEKRERAPNELQQLLADSNVQPIVKENRIAPSGLEAIGIAALGERTQAAFSRMQQIMRCRSDAKDAAKKGGVDAVLAEMAIPGLAREFATNFMSWRYRAVHRGRLNQKNAYAEMTDVDAGRAFLRKVEDIADRSTAALGPWWVK